MSDRELRDELVTVLGAGHETTATGLAWAIERLVRNPAVLAKLRDSLAAGEEEYLDATVKETLRARPVIVDVARKLTRSGDDRRLRAPGRVPIVLAAIAALHYREDVFPEPRRASAPSASSTPRSTTTPGSPSAAASAAASAPPSPNTRCARSCASSSSAPSCAPPSPKPEQVKIRNITLAPGKGARVVLQRRSPSWPSLRLAGLGLLPLARRAPRRRASPRAWRSFRPLDAAGAGPGGGVGELLLDLAQLGFGALDLLLQPGRLLRRFLRRLGGAVPARRLRRPAGFRRRRAAADSRFVAAPLVLGPAARRGCSACRPRRRGCGCRPPPAGRGRGRSRTTAPSNSVSASSSASRLSMSRWLVGSSRTRTLAPEATRIASESRRCSPPEMSLSCFSASAPEKRKPPSSARAFGPVRPVSRWAASSTVPSPAAVSACWER